jgi:UDP-N-acetylmuramate dehydrogenase
MSIFKKGEGEREIILSAKFRVTMGNKDEIAGSTREKEQYREDRHPIDLPNIGSTFKNVPVVSVPQKVLDEFGQSVKNDPFPILPVAKLISAAGLKEKAVGGAMVSPKHPNFIVNMGSATSRDVKELISQVKEEIKKKFDISLEEEIIYL